MTQYKVFHEDHETLGTVISPYRDSMNVENYGAIYQRHGLATIEPEKWYPMQLLLDVFSEMSEGGPSMMDFVSLGMEMSHQLRIPPEAENMGFEVLVNSVDTVYAYNNRGTDPSWIKGAIVEPKHARLEYRSPLPDDLLYGSLHGYAKRFLPKGTRFVVFYDETQPRREKGGETTIIHVKWE